MNEEQNSKEPQNSALNISDVMPSSSSVKSRKEILTFWVEHKDKRHYHTFHWDMIWVILKYKLVWGCKISFTVTKYIDCEKYICSFYVE
jgi:hypothetical protein